MLQDLAVSPNGEKLVIPYGNADRGQLAIFDCHNVNRPVDAHQGENDLSFVEALRSSREEETKEFRNMSFLPETISEGNSMLVATLSTYDDDEKLRVCIIDLDKRQVVSDGWNEASWKWITGGHHHGACSDTSQAVDSLLPVAVNDAEDGGALFVVPPPIDADGNLIEGNGGPDDDAP